MKNIDFSTPHPPVKEGNVNKKSFIDSHPTNCSHNNRRTLNKCDRWNEIKFPFSAKSQRAAVKFNEFHWGFIVSYKFKDLLTVEPPSRHASAIKSTSRYSTSRKIHFHSLSPSTFSLKFIFCVMKSQETLKTKMDFFSQVLMTFQVFSHPLEKKSFLNLREMLMRRKNAISRSSRRSHFSGWMNVEINYDRMCYTDFYF